MTRIMINSTALCFLMLSVASANNWPMFRGGDHGRAATADIPMEFGPGTNELWSVDLERGHSSPVVWDQSIYVTSHVRDSKTLSVHSIDASNGHERWKVDLDVPEIERFFHAESSAASSSVATDGKHVVAYFGSSGVYCLDHSGSQLWHFPMDPSNSYGGSGCSPIIHDGLVYLQQYSRGQGFALAIELSNGKLKWRHDYPNRGAVMGPSGSGTAVVHDDQVIFHNTDGISAHELKTGDVVWSVQADTVACSTPVISGDYVYVATYVQTGEASLRPKPAPMWKDLLLKSDDDKDGRISAAELPAEDLFYFDRPETNSPGTAFRIGLSQVDRNRDEIVDEVEWNSFRDRFERRRSVSKDHGLLAIKLGGTGDISKSHVTVIVKQAIPEVPSPVVDSNRIFIVKNGGILTCADLKTNKRLYKKRIGSRGTHYASPIVVGNHLLVADGAGNVVIVDVTGDKAVTVAKNVIGERIFATPAVVDDTIFVRTESKLYAFGGKRTAAIDRQP